MKRRKAIPSVSGPSLRPEIPDRAPQMLQEAPTLSSQDLTSSAGPLGITRDLWKRLTPVGLVAFCITFFFYFFSAAPTCGQGHDTGEVTTAALLPGVPHPPGYPLYVMQGILWSKLVHGEPAWVMNVNSGFCLALGMGILAAALTLITRPRAGLTAALLCGFCTSIWRQGVAAEVFALHLMFVSLFILLALLWEVATDRQRRPLVGCAAALLGLCFAHHHTIAISGPAFLLFGLLARGSRRQWGFHLWIIPIILLAGGIPYLFLYELAKTNPSMNWGNPVTWDAMWFHILRKAYGTGALNPASNENGAGAGNAQMETYFVTLLRNQYPFPTFLLILLGADVCYRARRYAHLVLFGGIAFFNGPFFAKLGNQPTDLFFSDLMERFYASSLIGLAGLLAIGLEALCNYLEARKMRMLSTLLVLALPLGSLAANWDRCDQSSSAVAYELSDAMLTFLPKDSMFSVVGDLNTGEFDYISKIQGHRPDVNFILPGLIAGDWFPLSLKPELRDFCFEHRTNTKIGLLQQIVTYYKSKGLPVFFNYCPDPVDVKGSFERYGPVWEYFPPEAPGPTKERTRSMCLKMLAAMLAQPTFGIHAQNPHYNFWTNFFINDTIECYQQLSLALWETDPEKALTCLDRALELQNPQSINNRKNRGILEVKLHRFSAARDDFEWVIEKSPKDIIVLAGLVDVARNTHDTPAVDKWTAALKEVQKEAPGPYVTP